MANVRIKDITTTASALNDDDYLAIDGATGGTRKMLASALEGEDGLTEDIKQALLQIAEKAVYVDDHGQDYYDDLYDALYPPVPATSITLSDEAISFLELNKTKQLTATVIPQNTTDTVAWSSSDTSIATVTNTGLVASVNWGTAAITATAGSVSASCSVNIAQATLTSISAVYTQSETVTEFSALDDLKADLVVTAHYSDDSTETVNDTDYTLSGTLTVGTSTITVSYENKTTTFSVTVTSLELYTVLTSDVGGWGYPSYDGVSYARENNLNNMDSSKTALKFVSTMKGTRPVLWDNIGANTEYAKYDGGLVTEFDSNGSSSSPSALKSVLFDATAIAMLRKITIKYTSLKSLNVDLSNAEKLTTVDMSYNTSLEQIPTLPDSVTSINFIGDTGLVDLSNWETPSGITGARTAFQNCSSIVKGPIINMPNCTTFNLMFQNANALKEITIESINNDYLFSGATGLVSNGVGNVICMVKCEPTNAAFPVIRQKLADSNYSYSDMKQGLTGRVQGSVNRICMYGDSLTKYGGDTGTYGTMPLQLLGMMASNVAVHNFGYPGSTASSYKTYFDARADLQAEVSCVWFGTNNIGSSGTDIAAGIQTNIIDSLTSDKYIVIGLLQGNYSTERNTQMAEAFGNHYLDIHAYAIANWESITGLTPTAEDEAAVSAGNIPPSILYTDNKHLNSYGGLVVATGIKEKLLSLGYINNTWLAS